jgi:WD40 repeat protein
VNRITTSPAACYAAATISSHEVWVFDSRTGRRLLTKREKGDVTKCAVVDDGHFAFATAPVHLLSRRGSEDVGDHGFGIGNVQRRVTWHPWKRPITALDLSSDAHVVALGDDAGDVVLWSARADRQIARWTVPGPVLELAFAPDQRRLAALSGGTLHIFDHLESPDRSPALELGSGIRDVSFSVDGEAFAALHDDGVSIHDRDGTLVAALRPSATFERLFFGPDRRHLVLVSRETCVLWRMEPEAAMTDLHEVTFLSISGDRSRLALRHRGGREISVWDVAEGREIARFYARRGDVRDAAFVTDDRLVVVENSGMRVEPILPAALEREVRRRLTSTLGEDDWKRYLPDEPYHPVR